MLESSPENTLRKACKAFNDVTGMQFEAMGELEYYVIAPDEGLFPATDQKGYHESAPYAKFNEFRTQCMAYIAQAGGKIKYGHSEVGNFTIDGLVYEQNEIEFLPTAAEDAADQLMIAKWIIRNLAYQYGYDITFAPKITAGKAGSGLHIHMRIVKDGVNQMLDGGTLSEVARKAIAGMMATVVGTALVPAHVNWALTASAMGAGVVAIGLCYDIKLSKDEGWKLVKQFIMSAGFWFLSMNVGSKILSALFSLIF
jgi:glutamine synthetase